MIHQVFLKVRDKDLTDYPLFVKSRDEWMKFCNKNDMSYKLWTDTDIEEILDEEDRNIFNKFKEEGRDPFVKCDYVRPLILKKFGGCYIDLDIFPKNSFIDLFTEKDIIFSCAPSMKKGKNELVLGGSVMKLPTNLADALLNYIRKQIYEKSKIKTYDSWKKRYLFHTVGPYALARWTKQNNISFVENIDDYITELLLATWQDKPCKEWSDNIDKRISEFEKSYVPM